MLAGPARPSLCPLLGDKDAFSSRRGERLCPRRVSDLLLERVRESFLLPPLSQIPSSIQHAKTACSKGGRPEPRYFGAPVLHDRKRTQPQPPCRGFRSSWEQSRSLSVPADRWGYLGVHLGIWGRGRPAVRADGQTNRGLPLRHAAPGAGPREPLGGRLREAWLSGTLQVQSRGWRKNLEHGELNDLALWLKGNLTWTWGYSYTPESGGCPQYRAQAKLSRGPGWGHSGCWRSSRPTLCLSAGPPSP